MGRARYAPMQAWAPYDLSRLQYFFLFFPYNVRTCTMYVQLYCISCNFKYHGSLETDLGLPAFSGLRFLIVIWSTTFKQSVCLILWHILSFYSSGCLLHIPFAYVTCKVVAGKQAVLTSCKPCSEIRKISKFAEALVCEFMIRSPAHYPEPTFTRKLRLFPLACTQGVLKWLQIGL